MEDEKNNREIGNEEEASKEIALKKSHEETAFEKNLEAMIEDDSSTSSSVENSILKKIRSR